MDIYTERGNMVSAVSRHLKNRGLADDVPKEQKNKEAEQTERILKSDLGDLKDLENKYK